MLSPHRVQPAGYKEKPVPSRPVPRQRPGLACEECRRRKVRCDRKFPCGSCADAATVCTTKTDRPPRGPKPGHLRALKGGISALERRLSQQNGPPPAPSIECSQTSCSPPHDLSIDPLEDCTFFDIVDEDVQWNPYDISPPNSTKLSASPVIQQRLPEASGLPGGPDISKLMHADLDQLYFDRAHIFVPIIHRRRYFSWTHKSSKDDFRTGLQYAMWTLATAFSAQFDHIREGFYNHAKETLDKLEARTTHMDSVPVELAQAWILLTIYEFMRAPYRQGWMTAGKSFRLVQLMRLYEIDGPEAVLGRGPGTNAQEDLMEMEERRRAFWMAYCLDRFISIRDGTPLTLNEQVIVTRLPAPDQDFQNSQPVVMDYLSELMTANDNRSLCSFTECITLATICGRSLSHRQQTQVERVYGDKEGFWDRHIWLDTILSQRLQALSKTASADHDMVDPMLLFTKILAQSTILLLYNILKTVESETDAQRAIMKYYNERSFTAAREIVRLVNTLTQFAYFKVHPFTPVCLVTCAEFVALNKDPMETFSPQLHEILEVLRNLEGVNNLARSSLYFLEFEDLTMSLRESSSESSRSER